MSNNTSSPLGDIAGIALLAFFACIFLLEQIVLLLVKTLSALFFFTAQYFGEWGGVVGVGLIALPVVIFFLKRSGVYDTILRNAIALATITALAVVVFGLINDKDALALLLMFTLCALGSFSLYYLGQVIAYKLYQMAAFLGSMIFLTFLDTVRLFAPVAAFFGTGRQQRTNQQSKANSSGSGRSQSNRKTSYSSAGRQRQSDNIDDIDWSRFSTKKKGNSYLAKKRMMLDPNASPEERKSALTGVIAADEGRVSGIKSL